MTDLCATAGVRSCDGFSHGPEMFGRYTGFPWNPSGSWAVCSIYGALRQDCLARNVCHVGVVISRWHHVTYLGKQRESVLGAWLLLGRRLCLRIDACGLCDQVFVTGDLSYCNSVLSSIRWEFIFSCRVVSLWNWRRYREWCSASLVLVSSGDQLLPSVLRGWAWCHSCWSVVSTVSDQR